MAVGPFSYLPCLRFWGAERERNTDRRKIGLKDEVPILLRVPEKKAAGGTGWIFLW